MSVCVCVCVRVCVRARVCACVRVCGCVHSLVGPWGGQRCIDLFVDSVGPDRLLDTIGRMMEGEKVDLQPDGEQVVVVVLRRMLVRMADL